MYSAGFRQYGSNHPSARAGNVGPGGLKPRCPVEKLRLQALNYAKKFTWTEARFYELRQLKLKGPG